MFAPYVMRLVAWRQSFELNAKSDSSCMKQDDNVADIMSDTVTSCKPSNVHLTTRLSAKEDWKLIKSKMLDGTNEPEQKFDNDTTKDT